MADFGLCERCGDSLIPVYFTEYEHETVAGLRLKTGRKRRAVSHLECPTCGKRFIVDDSYDGIWH